MEVEGESEAKIFSGKGLDSASLSQSSGKTLDAKSLEQSHPASSCSLIQVGVLRIEKIEPESGGLRWLNLQNPSEAEIAWLSQNFGFNALHLEDVTSPLQLPKIDDYESYLFVVLHFPVFDKIHQTIQRSEVDVFLSSNYLITIHNGTLPPLNELFERAKRSGEEQSRVLGRSSFFALYCVMDVLVDYGLTIVNNLSQQLEQLDDLVFKSTSRATVVKISVLRRNIIAFRRIIKPQIRVIANLEHRKRSADHEFMEGYFSDVKDHVNKIWESLEEYKDIIEGLSATYDSLSSDRLNRIIKTLTVISVVMLPLTLISGLYGMNIALPFADQPWSFLFILACLASTATVMLLFFRYHKWI